MFQLALSIATCLLSLVAGYVGASWRLDSGSLQLRKRVSALESAITTLELAHSNLTDTVKKVSRRTALTDYRERQKEAKDESAAPPPGDKAAAKRFYLQGRSHADVARLVQRGGEE